MMNELLLKELSVRDPRKNGRSIWAAMQRAIIDRLTGSLGKASGQPGMFQCRHSPTQCLNVFFLHNVYLHYVGNLRGPWEVPVRSDSDPRRTRSLTLLGCVSDSSVYRNARRPQLAGSW